ncbi:hypothetical protein FLONG3_5439 [Fusarium longipes]|uniref:Uncharacterized protein n=1 Tax=Fusarium longipes TaxID=694270 RepID=A0A395SU84_9HYPO|nr:hypothetical protein FLONG3_5439 [Fusarium longipes]
MELITFLLRVAAFTLFAALPAVQATYYDIPYNMTAGETFNVTINQKVDPDSENGRNTNAYRVYLALTPPGWGTGPVCWLEYLVPLYETQVNITIPPDVAPKDARMSLSTTLVNSRRSRSPVTGFDYSGRMTITGLTGNWSQAELDGRSVGDQNQISCLAYSCVRGCYEQYYKGDKDDEEYYEKTYDCWKACAKEFNPSNAASLNAVSFQSVLAVGVMAGFVHLTASAL